MCHAGAVNALGKGCLIAVGLLVSLVVAFGIVVWFVLGGLGDDEEALTEPTSAALERVEQVTFDADAAAGRDTRLTGHEVVFTYEAGGQTWRDSVQLPGADWSTSDPLEVCYDPDDPAQHSLRTEGSPECGETGLLVPAQDAEPVG